MRLHKVLVLCLLVAASTSAYAGEALEDFAKKCDLAIGPTVHDFVCDNGTEVPYTHPNGSACDRPNVLNHECDPGSRFQVLTNDANAYVVAHCRKRREDPGKYSDIAVIQHNKVNGATCFYQGALHLSHDGIVKAPSKGVGNPAFWLTPTEIATSGFPCASCHDNGPIIRSPYLAQVKGADGKPLLPGAGDMLFNRDPQPYSFVGEDFASWKAYKVEVSGNLCNSCHRLGVNNISSTGTARELGIIATDSSQRSKNPHSADSPIWMTPGQVTFSQATSNAAQAIRDCAMQFKIDSLPNSPECRITEFARKYEPPRPPPRPPNSLVPMLNYLLD